MKASPPDRPGLRWTARAFAIRARAQAKRHVFRWQAGAVQIARGLSTNVFGELYLELNLLKYIAKYAFWRIFCRFIWRIFLHKKKRAKMLERNDKRHQLFAESSISLGLSVQSSKSQLLEKIVYKPLLSGYFGEKLLRNGRFDLRDFIRRQVKQPIHDLIDFALG